MMNPAFFTAFADSYRRMFTYKNGNGIRMTQHCREHLDMYCMGG